ncbi:fluoride efflux transporter CrcB [Actinomycetospora cinnamomea]|uniref:Fluoride-specific ion channel FluC n=1 Tax=Actinomycetospora cinnamomea TaxID=663609 RepID=A0A2U1FLY8_9PSEU|nr:fluoride efflux transporter CrcB [Actinomycetospora cinnamomea]PVZ13050.1 protein CrcB [Actinomycetospora cinnamomea]
MTTTTGLLVILGAAVGAPARYLTDRWLQSTHGTGFPWGTFTVNIVASFVLGVIIGSGAGGTVPPAVAVLVGTGFCGALSTWSTLGYETVRLAENRAWTQASLNVVASVLAGLGSAGLGFAVAGGAG